MSDELVFRVYATFSPKAKEPIRFTTMASFAYATRHRAEEMRNVMRGRAMMDPARHVPGFLEKYGVTQYDVREEKRNGARVLTDGEAVEVLRVMEEQ